MDSSSISCLGELVLQVLGEPARAEDQPDGGKRPVVGAKPEPLAFRQGWGRPSVQSKSSAAWPWSRRKAPRKNFMAAVGVMVPGFFVPNPLFGPHLAAVRNAPGDDFWLSLNFIVITIENEFDALVKHPANRPRRSVSRTGSRPSGGSALLFLCVYKPAVPGYPGRPRASPAGRLQPTGP